MAQVILSRIGAAIGGNIGARIGAQLGRAADQALVSNLAPARQSGPRLGSLAIQSTSEGSAIPILFGRARLAGTVIWAARFRESQHQSGGKGGPKVKEYRYSLSFAVGLCEGPVGGIGRIWADGQLLETAGITWRLYRGEDTQLPDPLIEAVEGEAQAYRGLAYVVFEDLPLGAFGNRLPQLSFEVFGASGQGELEQRLTSVNLIPGTGEFALGTRKVVRRSGLLGGVSENAVSPSGQTDFQIALDQLTSQLPGVDHVNLVVAWFGDDLRCGACQIRPGVDLAVKQTVPYSWSVNGVDRASARQVSRIGGRAAYGGTPSDFSVLEAINEIRARGLGVSLYPILLMDIPAGNARPDPYGGSEQAAHPWRGRITCHPAAGRAGSPDRSAAAQGQVSAFFGSALPSDVGISGGLPDWRGAAQDFGYRRMILHYARLAQIAGGVESLIIGSELRGLTGVRDGPRHFPAVAALRQLASDCRAMLGTGVKLGYAADWSEYFGHQPTDGSQDALFHLDPLWADANIDFVGIDFYPPLTDWRAGNGGLDADTYESADDPAYLADSLEGGEGYDWFYATPAARAAQQRTPITDGAHGEPWMFRPKDLSGWWSHAHHDRPGGVRDPRPTAWQPGQKPIRLIEFGCAAIDRGSNAPNLFGDPKSSESALPPDSSGQRDDRMQRAALEAVLTRYGDDPMIERASVWCWDARPFPDFPARLSLWSDGTNYDSGHWINGRVGAASIGAVLREVLAQTGVALIGETVGPALDGYVIDRPMRRLEAIEPLLDLGGLDLVERGADLCLVDRSGPPGRQIDPAALALDDDLALSREQRQSLGPLPDALTVRFSDLQADYQIASLTVRAGQPFPHGQPGGGGTVAIDLPVVMDSDSARQFAVNRLADWQAVRAEVSVLLGPLEAVRLQVGDRILLDGAPWRVGSIGHDQSVRARLLPVHDPTPCVPSRWPVPRSQDAGGPVALVLLNLPWPGEHGGLMAACAQHPWRGVDLHAGLDGDSLDLRARLDRFGRIGELIEPLAAGRLHRIDHRARLRVQMEQVALESISQTRLLSGSNLLALVTPAGETELMQFLEALPVGTDQWELSGLLRGVAGTDAVMAPVCPAGSRVVWLGGGEQGIDLRAGEAGLPRLWRAVPAGAVSSDPFGESTLFAWRDARLRPWPVAHLRAVIRSDGGLDLSWIARRAETDDGWQADAAMVPGPWQVEIKAGTQVLADFDVIQPEWIYPAARLTGDRALAGSQPLTVRVRPRAADWPDLAWQSTIL